MSRLPSNRVKFLFNFNHTAQSQNRAIWSQTKPLLAGIQKICDIGNLFNVVPLDV